MLTQKQVLNRIEGKRDVMPMRYLKRRNVFVNYKESCAFDPSTGGGHSYRWYALTKVIKGKLVLNNYSYSNQTAKHVSKVWAILRLLKLSFIQIEAPQGLQNLQAAANYALEMQAKALVRAEFARKDGQNYAKSTAKHYAKQLEVIKSLGGKPSTNLKSEIERAHQDRIDKLNRMKRRKVRAAERALKSAQEIQDLRQVVLYTNLVQNLRGRYKHLLNESRAA